MARLIALPLFGTLVIAAMLLVLDRMLRLFDFVASEGGPVSVVWRMLANLLPEYLSLGIPIGLMLGILLAFRRVALSSELDVMRAVGLGYGRLLKVPYLFAIVLAAANLAIVGYVQPTSRYLYEELRFELRSGALGASIKVGDFNRLGDDMTLRIEESRARGTDLRGLFLRFETKEGQRVVASAEQGRFLRTDDPDTIILRLRNGVLVHDAAGYRAPRVLSFSNHDLPIPLPELGAFRTRGDEQEEATLPELAANGYGIGGPVATKVVDRNAAQANLHFRLVEVGMMLMLPLLALALAIPPKRSTSALGVFLSIIAIVTYHKINEYARDIAALGTVEPIVALWLPFAVFALVIGWMYHVIAHVPGGQPIGAVERVAAKAGKAIVALLPGRRTAAG